VGTGYHFEYLGPDPALYTMFELQNQTTDLNPSPLVAMIQTANQASDADFQKAMAQYLDWNQFLTYVAAEDYLVQNDGFLVRAAAELGYAGHRQLPLKVIVLSGLIFSQLFLISTFLTPWLTHLSSI
jgi:hypothetical protein